MTIRSFEQSDYAAVIDIYSNSKLDELSFEEKSYTFLPLEEDSERYTSLMESDIYVYDDGGALAYAAIFESEIRALYVHPLARGRGIGTQLLEFVLSKVTGLASLNVAKNNYPAKELYRQYGFEVINEFTASYNGVEAVANKMAILK